MSPSGLKNVCSIARVYNAILRELRMFTHLVGVCLSAKKDTEILTVHQAQKDSEAEGQGMKTCSQFSSFPLILQI